MPCVVLILASHDTLAARWSGWLSGDEFHVLTDRGHLPRNVQPDVVLTDISPVDVNEASADQAGALVVAISPATAEITLEAACLPRELRLACRLAGEIARLRRQSHPPAQPPLTDLSLLDELTGLPNRRAWQLELARRIGALKQERSNLCLVILDLDHFKQVNAGWGLSAGDRLLIASARGLRAQLRPGDFAARLGGDEFGLLISGLPRQYAEAVVDRVRRGVPAFAAREVSHVVGCSAGFACASHEQPDDAATLYEAADRALSNAKQRGRDVAVGDC